MKKEKALAVIAGALLYDTGLVVDFDILFLQIDLCQIFQACIDEGEYRNAKEHAKNSEQSASDRYAEQDPESGNSQFISQDDRFQDISVNLLKNEDKDREDQ